MAAQQRMEESLQASEKKYRTIFDNTGTATILIERDTTISMVNTEFEQLSGYSRAEVEGQRSWTDFISGDDVERMIDYHYRRRENSDAAPRNYVCGLVDRSGEMRLCYMTVALIPGTDQSVASLLDISERLRAEEALRESEERYRLLVETMNDGLGVQNEEGVIIYVNQRICQMIGYEREEILGRHTDELLDSYYRDIWREQMSRRQKRQYEPYEVAWRNRDGEIIHTIVSPRPLFDGRGNYKGSFAVFTDITARKKAEEAIRISEEKFSKGFRLSPDAMTITTVEDGRFVEVNDTFLNITGYSREETISHTVLELDIWPDELYRRALIGDLLKKGSLRNREVLFRVRSGEMRNGVYSAEIIDLQGVTCLISVFADVTEERRLEREVLSIGEEERRRIGQDLHDDLQQHLIGTEALSSLLAGRLAARSPEEASLAGEILDLLRGALEKTRRLARGLCPLYLDENGLGAALRELAAGIRASFRIACEVRMDRPVTLDDNTTAIHLFHIAQEAVTNAVRHGRANRVQIRLQHRQGGITMTVQDNGCGLPEEARLHAGLGLRIMRYRARMIGADLSIGNHKAGGARIVCQLKNGS